MIFLIFRKYHLITISTFHPGTPQFGVTFFYMKGYIVSAQWQPVSCIPLFFIFLFIIIYFLPFFFAKCFLSNFWIGVVFSKKRRLALSVGVPNTTISLKSKKKKTKNKTKKNQKQNKTGCVSNADCGPQTADCLGPNQS
jgi:hypothetical protein